MKITKTEKVWLGLTVLFYVLYNIPGLPSMGSSGGMLIHASLTIIPLWIVTYVGMAKVYKVYKIKE